MKLYHATPLKNLRGIREKGLVPVCDVDKKNFPECADGLYLTEHAITAEQYGYLELKKPFAILEVDIKDVLFNCGSIQGNTGYSLFDVLALDQFIYTPSTLDTSADERLKVILAKYGGCKIPFDKITIYEKHYDVSEVVDEEDNA